MQDSSPDVTTALEKNTLAPAATDAELAEAWFEAPPSSSRRPSAPPPPVSVVGEFIGDPLADGWLR